MIVGADKRVSRAFLATLRDEPSSVDLSAAFHRKERPGSTLTVSGLAHAITRAEEHMRERRSSRSSQPDIFDLLTATDDCAGPAVYKPYIPTPIPPPPSPEQTVVMPRLPSQPPPILVLDHQAFYHPPVSHSIAPRPAPRSSLIWAALAALPFVALVLLAIVIFVARPWQPQITQALPAPAKLSAPVAVEAPAPAPAPVIEQQLPAEEPILVVDVKALKPATSARPRR